MRRLLDLLRAMIGLGLVLLLAQLCGAYSVLTHEEVVDLCGKTTSNLSSPSVSQMPLPTI